MFRKDDSGEKGFVLILALVTMVAMTLIGISLVSNMTTDIQLSRNERESKIAFQLAEAGVNEAISRLHLPTVADPRYVGEKPADAGYRTTGWAGYVFNSDAAVVGTLGSGQSYTVTVRYLGESNTEGFCDDNDVTNTSVTAAVPPAACDQTPEEVAMYGRDFNIDASVTSIRYGRLPIYHIISTGTVNTTTRTVHAYVGGSSLNTDTEAGINTNSTITWNGGNCTTSVAPAGSCKETQANDYPTYLGEDLTTTVRDMADEQHQCSTGTCNGAGDDIPSNGQLDTVVADWGDAAGNSYSTFIYIDNPGRQVKMTGLNGRGILIVTGDLDLAGNVTYEGLIYVLGQLTISGGGATVKNVTGGIMARNVVTLNGANLTVAYDQATLLDVARQHSSSAMIVWKRL